MWGAAAGGGRRCSGGQLCDTTIGGVHSLKTRTQLHNKRAVRIVVVAAARDGKKRRKPASKTGGGSSSSDEARSLRPWLPDFHVAACVCRTITSDSGCSVVLFWLQEAGSPQPQPPAPRRVDPNINIPVRRQQMWARLVKEQMRAEDPSVFRPKNPARAFRKETLDSEEHRRCGAPRTNPSDILPGSYALAACVSLARPHTYLRCTDASPSSHVRRRSEQQEQQAEEARRYKSETGTLAQMFNTSVSAPGERPLGVTLVDGYNMLYSVRGGLPVWLHRAVQRGVAASGAAVERT